MFLSSKFGWVLQKQMAFYTHESMEGNVFFKLSEQKQQFQAFYLTEQKRTKKKQDYMLVGE